MRHEVSATCIDKRGERLNDGYQSMFSEVALLEENNTLFIVAGKNLLFLHANIVCRFVFVKPISSSKSANIV